MNSTPVPAGERYLFDNSSAWSATRFAALERCYDPVSHRNLTHTGLGIGWQCLEVGAGGGSLGVWLADAVGADGEVTVTDLAPPPDPSPHAAANLRLIEHDIVHDALPENTFDLVHARLVLLHLPQRHRVLKKLLHALRPGGHLVLEEFDCGHVPVLHAPDVEAAALFTRVHGALMELLKVAGGDPLWGRRAHGALLDSGYVSVRSTLYAEAWTGGGDGVALHRANTAQVREELHEAGISEEELEAFWCLLEDPDFAVQSYPLVAIHGRRPR